MARTHIVRTSALIVFVIAAAALVGCATPRIEYGIFSKDRPRDGVEGFSDTYMLQKTNLLIELAPTGSKSGATYSITLIRKADPTYALAIKPYNRYGVNTHIALTKIDNTQLVQTATISLEDKRTEFISKASKLLVTAISVASVAGASMMNQPTVRLPQEIDTLDLLQNANCQRFGTNCQLISALNEVQHGINAKLVVGPVPPDAMDREQFIEALSSARSVLAFSACREAELTVTIRDVKQIVRFSLADPRYVELVALPLKGSITSHSECGYSVVPENTVVSSSLDIAQSALDELIKLKAAYDKGSEDAKEKENVKKD